jgi:hypothetical protein
MVEASRMAQVVEPLPRSKALSSTTPVPPIIIIINETIEAIYLSASQM